MSNTDIFTRFDGTRWRFVTCASSGCVIIQPIPTPPQTEAEILAEMNEEIVAGARSWGYTSGGPFMETLRLSARAIVAACKKSHGREK